jgi:hypothetical protein
LLVIVFKRFPTVNYVAGHGVGLLKRNVPLFSVNIADRGRKPPLEIHQEPDDPLPDVLCFCIGKGLLK